MDVLWRLERAGERTLGDSGWEWLIQGRLPADVEGRWKLDKGHPGADERSGVAVTSTVYPSGHRP